MNERIEELAEQAGFMDSWFSESGDDCERELKKFSELIIQECIGELAKWKNEPFPFDADLAIKLLSEHFGIKKC
jgi:hypothetical protein